MYKASFLMIFSFKLFTACGSDIPFHPEIDLQSSTTYSLASIPENITDDHIFSKEDALYIEEPTMNHLIFFHKDTSFFSQDEMKKNMRYLSIIQCESELTMLSIIGLSTLAVLSTAYIKNNPKFLLQIFKKNPKNLIHKFYALQHISLFHIPWLPILQTLIKTTGVKLYLLLAIIANC